MYNSVGIYIYGVVKHYVYTVKHQEKKYYDDSFALFVSTA